VIKPNTVLVFSGKATSGKDTSFNILKKMYPRTEFQRFAFADTIKDIARLYFGWDGNKDEAGRRLLQHIGETGREYNKNIWVERTIEKISLLLGYNNKAIPVITDCRFVNEIDMIRSTYGNSKIIRLIGRESDLGKNGADISEHSLDDYNNFDFVIDNSGTLTDLQTKLKDLIRSIYNN
jgi:hypothetical protein